MFLALRRKWACMVSVSVWLPRDSAQTGRLCPFVTVQSRQPGHHSLLHLLAVIMIGFPSRIQIVLMPEKPQKRSLISALCHLGRLAASLEKWVGCLLFVQMSQGPSMLLLCLPFLLSCQPKCWCVGSLGWSSDCAPSFQLRCPLCAWVSSWSQKVLSNIFIRTELFCDGCCTCQRFLQVSFQVFVEFGIVPHISVGQRNANL